jgi:hypothetical protein
MLKTDPSYLGRSVYDYPDLVIPWRAGTWRTATRSYCPSAERHPAHRLELARILLEQERERHSRGQGGGLSASQKNLNGLPTKSWAMTDGSRKDASSCFLPSGFAKCFDRCWEDSIWRHAWKV